MSRELRTELIKTKNQTTTDIFLGEKARNYVRVMSLEAEMVKVVSASPVFTEFEEQRKVWNTF